MHWQYRTISWEKTSILYRLNLLLGSKTQDYILFCGLRSYGRLFDGGPIATSQVLLSSSYLFHNFYYSLVLTLVDPDFNNIRCALRNNIYIYIYIYI